jgi:hypothetical protein
MRIPLKGTDYFCTKINIAVEVVERRYLEAITPAIAKHKANAMLGDGTVAEVETFDPQNIQAFYQLLANTLKGWEFSGVSKSTTEDLHRLYCQFTKDIGKFHINGYFGVQFHALPYYKVDKRVIEIQKELARIADSAASSFQDMAAAADKVLKSELEQKGYSNLEFQQLFTKIFEDEKLIEDLDKKAASVEDGFPQFKEMGKRKNELFTELNNLLVELYQTSPVLIDYNRLMQGEEGITTYFDIEVIKNKKMKKREAYLDTGKISKQEADAVSSELANISEVLKSTARIS